MCIRDSPTVTPPSPVMPVPHVGKVYDLMADIMAGIAAAGGHAEAENDGEHDQGQHVAAAEQIGEVAHGEAIDQHLSLIHI